MGSVYGRLSSAEMAGAAWHQEGVSADARGFGMKLKSCYLACLADYQGAVDCAVNDLTMGPEVLQLPEASQITCLAAPTHENTPNKLL